MDVSKIFIHILRGPQKPLEHVRVLKLADLKSIFKFLGFNPFMIIPMVILMNPTKITYIKRVST